MGGDPLRPGGEILFGVAFVASGLLLLKLSTITPEKVNSGLHALFRTRLPEAVVRSQWDLFKLVGVLLLLAGIGATVLGLLSLIP